MKNKFIDIIQKQQNLAKKIIQAQSQIAGTPSVLSEYRKLSHSQEILKQLNIAERIIQIQSQIAGAPSVLSEYRKLSHSQEILKQLNIAERIIQVQSQIVGAPSVLSEYRKLSHSQEILKQLNIAETITKLQAFIHNVEEHQKETEMVDIDKAISVQIDDIAETLSNNKTLSFEQLKALILFLMSILFSLFSAYPSIKEIYKDLTYDPIDEICGVITELEKEAVKFVEVNQRGGVPLYLYPTRKKSEHYLIDGTRLCLVSQPKGNAKRVKVILQVKNHKQITGYVDRKAIKQLYKMD